MEKNSVERFSGKEALYAAGRPSYAEGFLQWLVRERGLKAGSRIADVGSGTGKLTKQLLGLGCAVFAVEPNAGMRQIAEADLGSLPGFCSVDGSASATGLPDRSVDAVTAAQAFHWFPPEEFRRECLRIGKENAGIYLIWNERDMESPVTQAIHRLYTVYGRDFHGFNMGLQKDDARIRLFFRDRYQEREFENPLHYDREGFHVRCLSSSHSPKEGDADFSAYQAEIDRIFDRFAAGDRLEVPNITRVYYGTL